ncbi:MAG: hypothetical protein HZA08_12290 [Nitrospirae bacterium]|nr:hypothetical protein [Nitrospirota bacterium]
MKVIFISIAILFVLFVTISSCGKKGDPIPPDKISTYNLNIDTSRGEKR